MIERSENFVLKRDHPLAKSLIFAGLGQSPGSSNYIDSSLYGNKCVFSNMDPKTDWVWIPYLKRWAIDFNYNENQMINSNRTLYFGSNVSWSFWVYAKSTNTSAYWIISQRNTNSSSDFYITCQDEGYVGYYTIYLRFNYHNIFVWPIVQLPKNKWSNITITKDNDMHIGYVNGVVVATHNFETDPIEFSDIFTIGKFYDPSFTNAADAIISDVMVYNRTLINNEVQKISDPSNVMYNGLLQPPKRKYYGFSYIVPIPKKYTKLGRLVLRS